jgi:hypothetical protein
MQNSNFVRSAGLWCIVGGAIAATGAIAGTIPSSVPVTNLSYPYTPAVYPITEVIWSVSHLLMFIGTLGLFRSGVVGESRLGRVGLWIALVGMALIVPSELGFAFFPTATMDSMPVMILSTAIGLATMVASLGFILAGIATLRERRWQGWQRFTPLLCGLFAFVVLIPVLVIRPELLVWPIAGWSACFIPLGLALYRQHSTSSASMATVGG